MWVYFPGEASFENITARYSCRAVGLSIARGPRFSLTLGLTLPAEESLLQEYITSRRVRVVALTRPFAVLGVRR